VLRVKQAVNQHTLQDRVLERNDTIDGWAPTSQNLMNLAVQGRGITDDRQDKNSLGVLHGDYLDNLLCLHRGPGTLRGSSVMPTASTRQWVYALQLQ
jgi:hypothetical protein